MTKIISKAAIACVLGSLALIGMAKAASLPSVPGTTVVIPVARYGDDARGYDRPDFRSYGPEAYYNGYYDGGYEQNSGGADEIRELQRAFPQTNWPPSMRY